MAPCEISRSDDVGHVIAREFIYMCFIANDSHALGVYNYYAAAVHHCGQLLSSNSTMLSTIALFLPLFGSGATAANLWATHYSGSVNHLTFSGQNLTLSSSTRTGNKLPSWITYDGPGKALCVTLDE